MKFSLVSLSVLLIVFTVYGCRKKNTAGLGGNNELRVVARHHSTVLDSMMVYIKFNALDAPNDISSYDISARVEIKDGDTMAIFTGLQDGEYYVFGKGFDPSIARVVKGGFPIELCEENLQTFLQVTEDGH